MNTQKRRQRQIKALQRLQKQQENLRPIPTPEECPGNKAWRIIYYSHQHLRIAKEIEVLKQKLYNEVF